jgi:hypothetical protein
MDFFQAEIEKAKPEVIIQGSLEKMSSRLPGQLETRFSQLQEIEAILKYLENILTRVHGKKYRHFLEKNPRQLSSRDAEKYTECDDDVIEISNIINSVSYIRNQFLSILKAFEYKHYQLGHLTKLKTAGMEDYEISR